MLSNLNGSLTPSKYFYTINFNIILGLVPILHSFETLPTKHKVLLPVPFKCPT